MTKTIKIAFVDVDTNEFFVKENVFSFDMSKAKLYLARAEIREFFDYVKHNSKRNLKPVKIEVSYSLLGDSDYLDSLDQKEYNLYKMLDKQATTDIDAMKENDYLKWRSLRSKYKTKIEEV
jgi:hypothetical protein